MLWQRIITRWIKKNVRVCCESQRKKEEKEEDEEDEKQEDEKEEGEDEK